MRGSVQLVRGATLACVLVAGAQTGCGRVEDTPAGGALASGGTLGGYSSGGAVAISSGGQIAATGGTVLIIIEDPSPPTPTPPGPCDRVYPGLDPPCHEEDLHAVVWLCAGGNSIAFAVPLTDVVPPAENLSLVSLPVDWSLGAGGLGGSGGLLEAGLELAAYSLSPETAGNIDGGSFAITQQAESVETSFDLSDGWPTDDYLESRGVRGEDEDWYAVAEIAVAQGNTVLSEHRLLVDDVWICTR